MLGLYTPKTIRKVRENVEVKRNFLTELFFKKGTPVPTEEIILEYTINTKRYVYKRGWSTY